jgi:Putative peptidoglycan binding domain
MSYIKSANKFAATGCKKNPFMKHLSTIIIFFFLTQNLAAQYVFDSPIPVDSFKIGTYYAHCILMRDAVLAKEIKVKYIPPQFDTFVENIEISPAFTYFELHPNASVKPLIEGEKVTIVPPKIDIKQDRIKVFEGYNKEILSVKSAADLGISPSLCVVICNVEVPAEYRIFKYKTFIEPAKIIRQRPDTTLVETIKDTSQLLIKIVEAPQYFKVKKLVQRKPSYFHVESPFDVRHLLSNWREVFNNHDCFSNPVRKIQRALNERGYQLVEDDIFGPKTKKALTQFQTDFNLPLGTLNSETLKALGLDDDFKPPPFSIN